MAIEPLMSPWIRTCFVWEAVGARVCRTHNHTHTHTHNHAHTHTHTHTHTNSTRAFAVSAGRESTGNLRFTRGCRWGFVAALPVPRRGSLTPPPPPTQSMSVSKDSLVCRALVHWHSPALKHQAMGPAS